MLTKRPLLDTAADQALFVADRSRDLAVEAGLLRRNTLIIGDAGSGKSSLLYRIRGRACEARALAAIYVDARSAVTGLDLVDLIMREAVNADWVPGRKEVAGDDPFRLEHELERLKNAPEACVVLIDDPAPKPAFTLFGRFRDVLWQLPTVFAVAATPAKSRVLKQHPADVFFDVVIELEPLAPAAASELLRLRKERGYVADGLLPPSRPMQPGAILVDADAGPTAARHDAEFETELRRRAAAAGGYSATDLLAEIWGRGASSASDTELQRSLNLTRARLTQLLRVLEGAEVLVSFPDPQPTGIGRPRTLYDVNARLRRPSSEP